MAEATRERACWECRKEHPNHLTVTRPESGIHIGLECLTPAVRLMLGVPTPEEAQEHYAPVLPPELLQGLPLASELFDIETEEEDAALFAQAMDELGLSSLSAYAHADDDANPTVTRHLHHKGQDHSLQVLTWLYDGGRVLIHMQTTDRDPAGNRPAKATLTWKDTDDPRFQNLHQRIANSISLAQTGGIFKVQGTRPVAPGNVALEPPPNQPEENPMTQRKPVPNSLSGEFCPDFPGACVCPIEPPHQPLPAHEYVCAHCRATESVPFAEDRTPTDTDTVMAGGSYCSRCRRSLCTRCGAKNPNQVNYDCATASMAR